MTKSDFRNLFLRALDFAARNAEKKLGNPVARSFKVELHAPGSAGGLVSVEEALDRIYLGSDRFFRVIDVAIKEVLPMEVVAFVRVSGHEPGTLDKTWDPPDAGPFKQIMATAIEDHRVHSG